MEDFKVHKVFRQSTTGISLAVVIPSEYAKELELVDGSHVFIRLQEGKLVIEKVNSPQEAS